MAQDESPPQETPADPASAPADPHAPKSSLAALALGAVGVVFGDIGTSPLYTMREAFGGPHAVVLNHDNVLGVLSLIVWSLGIIVTLKYVAFVMRADNRGEGGIMARAAAGCSPWWACSAPRCSTATA